MTNPTDAREAFIQEVFGEILKVEKSVKATADHLDYLIISVAQAEAAISFNTEQLVKATNQLAVSHSIVDAKSKVELKDAIHRINTSTVNLATTMQPLTELTLGLREVARVEAKKQMVDFLDRKEKKLDSMLAVMDVFLQQIELASERLPQLATAPRKVSQINEGNMQYLKDGWSLRTMKRYLQNKCAKAMGH